MSMKVWKRITDGKMMGYQEDFPNGLEGCSLEERGTQVIESTAVRVEDKPTVEKAVPVPKKGK